MATVSTGQAITTEFDVPATMRDGVVLRANVYRPATDGRFPVLLQRLPYGKDLPGAGLLLDPLQAARQGFVVIVQDTRGRFRSDGDWYPLLYEAKDGYDTVQWAAALPYADGSVGMYGASYFGFTQWAAAREHPAALKAMIPTITWQRADDGMYLRGGAFELGIQAQWNLMMGADVVLRRHAGDPAGLAIELNRLLDDFDSLATDGYRSLPLGELAPFQHNDVAPVMHDVFVAPDLENTPVFRAGTHAPDLPSIEVPTFSIGGWYDIFLAGTLQGFRAMREQGRPAKLLIGPWSHGGMSNPIGDRSFGFGAQAALIDRKIDLGSLQLRWFNHWLRGVDTGMLQEPPVQIFVMGIDRWRFEDDWPLERARTLPHYLHAGGGLDRSAPTGSEAPDAYDYDPANPVPTRGGALLLTAQYPAGVWNQAGTEARDDVLVYTSGELEQDVEVTGPIAAHIWLATSAPDTDVVVRLCDVRPDGTSYNLTDGILRGRHRGAASGLAPSPLTPGEPTEFEVDLWATSNVFLAGHRIRVQVTSSNFPRWDRNLNTGRDEWGDAKMAVAHQQVLHDAEHPSRILLPVVPKS